MFFSPSTGLAAVANSYGSYAWLLPWIIFFNVIGLIVGIAIYIYTALALMRLAKKIGVENSWLAWVPIANLYLISTMAGMPWWPMLLLLGILIPFVNLLCILGLVIWSFMCMWKIFERVGKPGWWALTSLIPLIGSIIFLVLLGIAAFGKDNNQQPDNPVAPTAPMSPIS